MKGIVLDRTAKPASAASAAKTRHSWVPGVALAALLVPVSLVGLELIFRAAHVGEEEYLKVDPVLGYTHLENQQITFRSEGYSSQKTNAGGMFDVGRSVAKPPGVIRIAILGDSNVEALQVPFKSWFGRLLENRLNDEARKNHLAASGAQLSASGAQLSASGAPLSASGAPLSASRTPLSASAPRKFEVLNFGMGSYSTGQEYYQWLRDVAGYEPDVTIVCFHALDSGENIPPPGGEPSPRPYFTVSPEGKLSCDWTSLNNYLSGDNARYLAKTDWLRRNSRLWGAICKMDMNLATNKYYKPIHAFFSRLAPKAKAVPLDMVLPERDVVTALDAEHSSVDKPLYHPTPVGAASNEFDVYERATQSNFNVTAAIVRRLSHACNEQGSKLIIATLPAPNNMFFYLQEIADLKRIGKQEGFDVVNLNDVFPSLAPTQPSPLFYHIHMSPAGHKLVAETLYKQLAPLAGAK